MSRRAFLLAILAFCGSVGGYLLARGGLQVPNPSRTSGPAR